MSPARIALVAEVFLHLALKYDSTPYTNAY